MKVVVDTETGQVLTEINDGDRIVRASSAESALEFCKAPKDEAFSKLYQTIIPALVGCELTAAELIIFIHLATNLRYQSNVSKCKNGKLITRSSLESDLNISEPTVKRSIRKLSSVGLIVEARTIEGNVFVVNPYVVIVGDKINKTVYDLFRKSKWARW